MELKATYFENPGKENTEEVLRIVRQRAEELGIKTIGAALTLFVVNRAVATHGASEKRMPRSKPCLAFFFIPAPVAPARNPLGEVTVPSGINSILASIIS